MGYLAGALLLLGFGVMIVGIARTFTARRDAQGLRRAVATGMVGFGVVLLGIATLILATGEGTLGYTASAIIALVGVTQFATAALITRRAPNR